MTRYMMSLIVIGGVVGFVLFGEWAVQAQTQPQTQPQTQAIPGKDGSNPQAITPSAVNNQTAVACNLCFGCGGDWPVFAGSFASPGTNNATERGAACAGAQVVRTDGRPFLCCR